MAIEKVQNIIERLSSSDNWNIYTLRYKYTKKHGAVFESRQIRFRKRKELLEYIDFIQNEFLKNTFKKYNEIREYDGTCNSSVIYYFQQKDSMITENLQLLNESLAKATTGCNEKGSEGDKENAFILQGTIKDENDEEQLIKLITLRKPFTTLKNKFCYEEGEYKKIDSKVLNLGNTFDVLILGNEKVYFMNLNGESLFNLERVYKAICYKKVEEVCNNNILSDNDAFAKTANSGHNPRKFVLYDDKNLKYISVPKQRKRIAEKFQIKLNSKGEIDTSDSNNVNKLIKFLCNRAVLDPTNLEARESDGTKKWS